MTQKQEQIVRGKAKNKSKTRDIETEDLTDLSQKVTETSGERKAKLDQLLRSIEDILNES